MSEMAKKARAALKEKAGRMTTDPHQKVDASSWTPPEPLETEAKVGMRPISRRAFKKGGKVEGEKAMHHAGKRPRKAAGGSSDFLAMANANKDAAREAAMRRIIAEGEAPVPMPRRDRIMDRLPTDRPFAPEKRGGRIGRKDGGKALTADSLINRDVKEANEKRGQPHVGGYKKGGKVHEDAAMDKKLIKAEMAKHEKGCRCEKCWGGSMGKAGGGSAGNYDGGTRPTGGRIARKSGGRAKGKTNIHINIIAGEKHPDGVAPPMGLPGPLPRPPMPVAPPPMAGGAGMPPMGPPPAPMGGALPPGLGVPPPAMGPMARKAGGRVGHRSYSSYKDMDAGAGGGLGRLEKTEIAKKKG